MIKVNIINGKLVKRLISSLLAFLTVAALFLPVITLWAPEVNALPNNTEYIPDDTYLSGTDFSDHTVGVLAEPTKNYTHYVNGKSIYQAVPKNSTIRIMSEMGNKFVRYDRSNNTSSNDVYIDMHDTQKDIYTGDFVIEASYRFVDYPKEFGGMTLMQFINRDKGNMEITGGANDNLMQQLITMSADGSIIYKGYNPVSKKDLNVDTGFDMTIGEWLHLCVVMHRNENDVDYMDVYVNGQLISAGIQFRYPIKSIYQIRIAQTPGGIAKECKIDIDNLWIYKGSSPAFTVGSGAHTESLVGSLDYSDSALAVGSTVKGKISTDKFEIDAKDQLFSVHKDTWRTLLKMDHGGSSAPYVDVFAKGAKGALVADMSVILGDDWDGNALILSPFAISGDYVSRENLLSINGSRQLVDRDGNVLAELGTKLNRIAIGFSADRGFATVFVNGKNIGTLETTYGEAYKNLGGIRAIEFADTTDAGTAYIYYAEIYRGSLPAIALGDTKLEYHHDFDGITDASQVAPITFIGSATLRQKLHTDSEFVCALNKTATAGSAVRYASAVNTSALSVSFTFGAGVCGDMDVLRLGNTPILSLSGEDGRLYLNTADGAVKLFKTELSREYQIAITVISGTVSLYADGIPFVRNAALTEAVAEKVDSIDFLYAATDGSYNAHIDSLEIYTGGTPFVSGANIPIAPQITAKEHKASLTWSEIGMADGYRVYRSLTESGEFKAVSELITDNAYTDSEVIVGQKYFYRVGAVFIRSGEEFVLGLDGAPTPFEDVDPALNVVASSVPGGIKLTWNQFHSASLGYSVYRSFEENSDFELIAEKLSTTEYTDTEAFPGLVTYYKVCVVIERDGEPFVFGLEQRPIEATAGAPEEEPEIPDDPENPDDPETPDDPTKPDDGDGEKLPEPMPPVDGGISIPTVNSEKSFGTDFEAPLADIEGITSVGNGISAGDSPASGKALSLTVSDLTGAHYVSLAQSAPTSLALLIDISVYIDSAESTFYLLAPETENEVLFRILEAKSEGDTVTLYMGAGVGGENKALSSFKTGEWHRITVWITATGDKAAIYLDGACLMSDADLPANNGSTLISAMTSLRLMGYEGEQTDSGANASPIDTQTAISVFMDDVSIRNTDVFASAFNSAVLTPKVNVFDKENRLSWKAANGALYYTVWRADESGVYTVIADNLKINEYVDKYEKDCSYKVTYTYGNVGVNLTALISASGITAKKTPVEAVIDTVVKLIDLSKPGTLGILIITAFAFFAIVLVLVIRRFVLKVDPPQPNRINRDTEAK